MSKSFVFRDSDSARVVVDALAGQGAVFLEGQIVHRQVLGEYFDALVSKGALELCEAQVPNVSSLQIELY